MSITLRDTMMAARMGNKNPVLLMIALAAFALIWWLSHGS